MEQIKKEMKDYWSRRVDAFSAQRCREFQSPKHELWLAEFAKYLPQDKALRILDIGTGTGFFASLLSGLGHYVVGIDLTDSMIAEAKRKRAQYGWQAEFHVMDAEKMTFPEQSFDAIVTRNLTWALPHLPAAYRHWRQFLKEGSVLINFDADYCHEQPCHDLPPQHAHESLDEEMKTAYERMKDELRQDCLRPEWDKKLLGQAGFSQIYVDTDVWQRIYAVKDEFYNPTPIFTVVAKT